MPVCISPTLHVSDSAFHAKYHVQFPDAPLNEISVNLQPYADLSIDELIREDIRIKVSALGTMKMTLYRTCLCDTFSQSIQ